MRSAPKVQGLAVAHRRCPECLFGPNKIVSDARRDQVLAELEAADKYFLCHRPEKLGRDHEVVCAGFVESFRRGERSAQGLRLAVGLGVIVPVDPDTGVPVAAADEALVEHVVDDGPANVDGEGAPCGCRVDDDTNEVELCARHQGEYFTCGCRVVDGETFVCEAHAREYFPDVIVDEVPAAAGGGGR